MWNKLSRSSANKPPGNLNPKQKKATNALNPRMVMTIILLFITIFALAIYKFNWVKIIVKHGESMLQIEGSSLNQGNKR